MGQDRASRASLARRAGVGVKDPAAPRPRGVGRPLIAGMALISAWVAIRASTWEPPFPMPSREALFAQVEPRQPSSEAGQGATMTIGGAVTIALTGAQRQVRPRAPLLTQAEVLSTSLRIARSRDDSGRRKGALAFAGPAGSRLADRSRLLAGHEALFATALSYGAASDTPVVSWLAKPSSMKPGRGRRLLPVLLQAEPLAAASAGMSPNRPSGEAPGHDRWSGDAWLLVRGGGASPTLASVNPAAYGGDQAGAVVRYALTPSSRLAPSIYARASKALASGGEREAAAGVSVSLARNFPLSVHGEARVTDRFDGAEVRPAAFVATGLPRRAVGPWLEADAYVQVGYVGGRFGTGFVDGKATLEAPVGGSDQTRFTVGGGAWGGAQRDASRLDLGPTASVNLSTGSTTLRASVDYRVRVAGDASPGNGVAVTLAASF